MMTGGVFGHFVLAVCVQRQCTPCSADERRKNKRKEFEGLSAYPSWSKLMWQNHTFLKYLKIAINGEEMNLGIRNWRTGRRSACDEKSDNVLRFKGWSFIVYFGTDSGTSNDHLVEKMMRRCRKTFCSKYTPIVSPAIWWMNCKRKFPVTYDEVELRFSKRKQELNLCLFDLDIKLVADVATEKRNQHSLAHISHQVECVFIFQFRWRIINLVRGCVFLVALISLSKSNRYIIAWIAYTAASLSRSGANEMRRTNA